jgi:hypothetical protein
MFHYFLKVVSTQFRTLDGEVVNSHQYSVTHFERDLETGAAGNTNEGIQVVHGVNGLPGEWAVCTPPPGCSHDGCWLTCLAGVFFSYEISPILVAHHETRQSFAHFLTSYVLFYYVFPSPGLSAPDKSPNQNMCHRGRRTHGGFYSRQRALRNATQLQERRRDGRTC